MQKIPPVALVVEDEFFIRICIADSLGDAGWQVFEAATGEEAVQVLERGQQIDLLVTDIRLSGMLNGWDIAERSRALHANLPVLYFSATPRDMERQVPDSRFLAKPAPMSKLLDVVASLRDAHSSSSQS